MPRMRRLALAAALVVGLAAPAWAGFDDAVAAYNRGDYATVLRELRPLAEQGDPAAQYSLGHLYANGLGVPQDFAEAVRWIRMAAEQGNAQAQVKFALMYTEGLGVTQDYTEAAKWTRLAAEQGIAPAQSQLGVIYHKGRGVPQDFVLAHMWLNLAAAQDQESAAKYRNIVAAKMTPAQVAEAQRLAREWLEDYGN